MKNDDNKKVSYKRNGTKVLKITEVMGKDDKGKQVCLKRYSQYVGDFKKNPALERLVKKKEVPARGRGRQRVETPQENENPTPNNESAE